MAVEFINPKNQYQAGENIGHSIALKDANIKALMDHYQNSNVLENSAIVEEVSQELNSPMEEAVVQTEPEMVSEIATNPLDNAIEAAETTSIEEPATELEIQPIENASLESLAPVIEEQPQSVITDTPIVDVTPQTPVVDINPEITIQDAPVLTTEQQVVDSTPMVQPEMTQNTTQSTEINVPNVNTTVQNYMGLNDIRTALNNALIAVDQLEKMQAEMEAKLVVANQAFENAQNINSMANVNENQEEGQSLSLSA